MSRRLDRARGAQLTYDEVGASLAAELPPGYHQMRQRAPLGSGAERFARASEALMAWQVQHGAGLTVEATHARVELGAVVVTGVGVGPLRLYAPCRVVRVVDEPRRSGFAYGTLPRHPETGEEAFVVVHGPDDVVRIEVVAFSRPSNVLVRLGAPVTWRVQAAIGRRYLTSLLEA